MKLIRFPAVDSRMWIRLIIFILIGHVLNAQSRQGDTLRFATYRYADNDRVKNITPFANWFSQLGKRPVTVTSFESVHALLEAMKNKKVDIVFINTFGYLLSREYAKDYTIAAALHLPEKARSTYQTVIVASKVSQLRSLDDLTTATKKFSLLLVNPGSTSGNLIPRLRLAEAGIHEPEKFFKSVSYTKNHALTLQQVIAGSGDVGAFGSEEFYKAQAEDKDLSKKVQLLWESEPIPLGPVLFQNNLDTTTSAQLINALLNLHRENDDALHAIKSGWTEAIPADKFHNVDESYYTSIIKNDPVTGMNIIRVFAR